MKKWLVIVLSVLASVLVMSHNSFAAEPNIVVYNPYSYTIDQVECAVQNGTITVSTGNTCVWGPNVGGVLQGTGFSFIATHTKFWVRTTSVYEVYVDVSVSTNAELMVPAVWDSFNSNGNFQLISFEKVSHDDNLGSSATYEGYTSTYRFVVRPKVTAGIGIEIGDNSRNTNWLYLVGDNWPVVVDTRITAITAYDIGGQPSNSDIVEAINELKESNQEQVQQEREELEQGQSDLQEAGGDSTSDAQQGTASLIAAIGQAVGVITNASPTNCLINGNMGHLNMGQLDLCSTPVPSFITVIGTLILILCVVPLCISLFNRFIGLFRSFQG